MKRYNKGNIDQQLLHHEKAVQKTKKNWIFSVFPHKQIMDSKQVKPSYLYLVRVAPTAIEWYKGPCVKSRLPDKDLEFKLV